MEHIQKKKRVTTPPPQTIAEKKLDQALWALPPEIQDLIAAWHYHTNGISAVHYCKRRRTLVPKELSCVNYWLCGLKFQPFPQMKKDDMCRVCYYIADTFNFEE